MKKQYDYRTKISRSSTFLSLKPINNVNNGLTIENLIIIGIQMKTQQTPHLQETVDNKRSSHNLVPLLLGGFIAVAGAGGGIHPIKAEMN
ncbi:MAG: hypothetical protein ACFFD4_11080 [Candidatus Odinarchaeota archaeon]